MVSWMVSTLSRREIHAVMHRISAIIATAISRHAARMRSARMCWEKGVYSYVACCDPFYENQCWDNDYTYDRCCVPYEKKLQAPSPCDASATLPPTLLSRGASPLPFKGVSDREIMTSGGVFTAADASDVSAQCCWGATLPPHALGLGLPVLDAILAAETVSSYLEAYVLGSLRSWKLTFCARETPPVGGGPWNGISARVFLVWWTWAV